MEVTDLPDPRPPERAEVLVRPEAVGICGSDFHFFLGELPVGTFPRIQGHEIGGTIEAVGPAAARTLRSAAASRSGRSTPAAAATRAG